MSDRAQARKDFNEIDTDNDGYITIGELKESHKNSPKVSDENVAALFRMADDDGDKKISYEEYARLVR